VPTLSAGLGTSVMLGRRTADEAVVVLRHWLDELTPRPAE
jgi:hypothetical protein